MENKAKTCGGWIWTNGWNEEDSKTPRLVYFRKEIVAATAEIGITADCRYKLYVNGKLTQYGPAKGDHRVHYIDKAQLPGTSREKITLAIVVLHYPEDPAVGNHGMFSSDIPGLYLEGVDLDGWKCFVDSSVCFEKEEERFAPLWIHERHEKRSDNTCLQGWKETGYDDSAWQPALIRQDDEMPAYLRRDALKERTIPMMFLKDHCFDLPVRKVEPFSRVEFVLDAGEEMCAFPMLFLRGANNASICLAYSECYVMENGKGDRIDAVNGHLEGYSDIFEAGSMVHTTLETFWFRTFRFIKVTIETGSQALYLDRFAYLETGYPLEVSTHVTTSDASLAPIWDISLRTLRRCMHETYVDCPYYEQLQYAMDTRSEILYTYAVSGDDRLARKSIGEFARAQRPDGLINCSYPNKNINVIPGFSIYYILMVHDHMMYFGDADLVQEVLPAIHRILHYFDDRRISSGPLKGLVGKTGGINGREELWSFIDWAQEWMPTEGMPAAGQFGPITMESLLYILGLQKAAELEEYAGDPALASKHRSDAEAVQKAVRTLCMDRKGVILDGPLQTGYEDKSQHCQVFGVLTGTLSLEEGRRNLLRSLTEKGYARCSVSMCFYLFRALEETDLYEYTDGYWEIWRQMVRNHCTTCVEAEFYARSECHAWGALALYELPSVVLGVRPGAPGYEKVIVKPCPGYMTSAEGTVVTPAGKIHVKWDKKNGELGLQVDCGEELREKLILLK